MPRIAAVTVAFVALLALVVAPSCDGEDDTDACVVHRAGPPEVLYLSQNDAEVDLQTFSKIVLSCDGVEDVHLALTWTAHPLEDDGSGVRTLGLAFSTTSGDALIECYRDIMLKLGTAPP